MNRSKYISGLKVNKALAKAKRISMQSDDDICVCGHPRAEHADVPGISKDACWGILDCQCERFRDE